MITLLSHQNFFIYILRRKSAGDQQVHHSVSSHYWWCQALGELVQSKESTGVHMKSFLVKTIILTLLKCNVFCVFLDQTQYNASADERLQLIFYL